MPTCKKICELYKSKSISNQLRYKKGDKRCTFCSIYIDYTGHKCPCCGLTLRAKSRKKSFTANS